MTVTIHLPSDIEAALVAQARGLDITQYVEHVLREQIPSRVGAALSPAEQRAQVWRESAQSLPHTPLLSEEEISRESIYSDRG